MNRILRGNNLPKILHPGSLNFGLSGCVCVCARARVWRAGRLGVRCGILRNCRLSGHLFGASRKSSQEAGCPASQFSVGNPRAKGSVAVACHHHLAPGRTAPFSGKGPSTLRVTTRPRALSPSPGAAGWAAARANDSPGPFCGCRPVTRTRLPHPGARSGTNLGVQRGRRRGQWVSALRGRWAGPTALEQAGQPVGGRWGRAGGSARRAPQRPLRGGGGSWFRLRAQRWWRRRDRQGCNRRPSGSGWSGSGGRAQHEATPQGSGGSGASGGSRGRSGGRSSSSTTDSCTRAGAAARPGRVSRTEAGGESSPPPLPLPPPPPPPR